MTKLLFSFATARTANQLVAGVPAAARLARAWYHAFPQPERAPPLPLQLRDGGHLSQTAMAEIDRLTNGQVAVQFVPSAASGALINGEDLPDAAQISQQLGKAPQGTADHFPVDEHIALRRLAGAERNIIKATGKAGDGIVSRWLNRPVSQSLSQQLLKHHWIRPGHATLLTALAATAMVMALIFGGQNGLIAGAILFQLASILDGVDGEIARATWRTSERGAMLDSATDAATNLGFLIGIIVNRWQAGAMDEVALAVIGLCTLMIGLVMLGYAAKRRGEPLNFDRAKKLMGNRPSRLKTLLRYVTMRDFYCLFLAVMVVCGLLQLALLIFAISTAAWLAAISFLMLRDGKTDEQ